jgi:hypothetical protein
MHPLRISLIAVLSSSVLLLSACSKEFVGGAAAGAAVGGGAYEYQNKQALEDLEDDFEEGKISREEYLRRKKEIESKSLIY